MMKHLFAASLGLYLAISGSNLAAQAMPMLPLDKILEKMESAVDPEKKLKDIKSFQSVYEGALPVQSIKVSIDSSFKPPDKSRRVVRAEGMPDTIEICNGNSAWTEVAGLGITKASGAQLNFKLLILKMTNPANQMKDIFPKIELAPVTEMVGEKNCYKLNCFPDPALGLQPMQFYVDRSTFFVVKMIMTVDSEMGPIPSETTVNNYRSFDGVYFPVEQSTVTLGMTMTTKIVSLKFNVELKDSDFTVIETPVKP